MKTNLKKIILSGGGTGGHIFPAIAVAEMLKSRIPEIEILFVGALGKMEMEKVPQFGFKIIGLPIAGWQRTAFIKNLSVPFKLIRSLWIANKIVQTFNPDCVIGFGGYASGPMMKICGWRNIPIYIQEQNSFAGITNKIMAKKAKKIFVAYENMENYFPASSIKITGNPIRNTIQPIHKSDQLYAKYRLDPNVPTVLVVGGSLGAKTINTAILNNLNALSEKVNLIWQTGKIYYEDIRNQTHDIQKSNIIILPFITEMNEMYALADWVVARSGALTVSELSQMGKAVIFVPSPNVAEDHQTKNAKALVDKNAAIMIKDADANDELAQKILVVLQQPELQKSLSENIKQFAKPNAAEDIVNEILIES